MHINNPDALKIWLEIVLKPLCDADPLALARYVLALLKKNQSPKDLQQSMSVQLDVFLGAETEPFLVRLFEVIQTEEYLDSAVIAALKQQQQQTVAAAANSNDLVSGITEPITSSQETNNTASTSTTATASDSDVSGVRDSKSDKTNNAKTGTSTHLVSNEQSTTTENESDFVNTSPLGSSSISKLRDVSPISPVKSAIATDNDGFRREPRRRTSARSRSRSRSRSRREKYNRQHYRNKSPPALAADSDNRRKGNPFRRNSGHEIRSPKYYKRSHSPMDNMMPDDRKAARSLSPMSKGDRCRDFDEKGYCMRGETCPWDHGVNPVVLEDINNPTLMTIQTAPLRSAEYNPDAPELWIPGGAFNNGTVRPGAHNGPPNTYQRLPAGAAPAGGFRGGPPFPFPGAGAGATPLQRELISVPVIEANSGGDISATQKRRYEPEDTVAVAEGPTKRKIPINSRLGPPGRVSAQNNCSLELRKVPRGLNSIAHLNNHFCKFGKIVNIQVSYEGDPEAAIVTFSTHAEANVAYRSTEAVLNNRFIKVFWHSSAAPGGSDANHNTSSGTNASASNGGVSKEDMGVNIHGRKASQYSLNNVPATPTPASTDAAKTSSNASIAGGVSNTQFTKTNTTSVTTSQSAQLAANRIRNSRINRSAPEALRKKKEEQVKAAAHFAHGLHKRKHELVQGYLKQMRTCVEIVERIDSNDPQRPILLETIKSLQKNIDALNKEIASEQAQLTAQIVQPAVTTASASHPYKKSKELAIKEILDTELELMAQQQDGQDTTVIQKRIEELQKKLGTVSKPVFPVRNSRVRPAPPGSTSVDRRPTTILIIGFAVEDCDTILGHFKHFGEITKNDIDKETPALRITYATRLNAEQAMLRGRKFKDKQLQISWFIPHAEPPKTQPTEEELLEEVTADDSTANENEMRLEDEDDDEESEDRSWRR